MGIDAQGTSGTVMFDVAITDLNEDQDIAEPQDAKPFTELLGQLGGLGLAPAPAARRRPGPDGGAGGGGRPGTCRSTPSASPRPVRTSTRPASAQTS